MNTIHVSNQEEELENKRQKIEESNNSNQE